jgi:hypothetical protein
MTTWEGADVYISPDQDAEQRSATVWQRVSAQSDVDGVLQSRAVVELKGRLQHWNGDYLPRPSRFKNKKAIDRGHHLVVPADPVELVIVRAVAMTEGAAQFGVSPNGAIFTAEGDGWTIRGARVDVTRLSWLLDEAADILQQIRHGRGGRFYERDGRFFLADDKTTILEVVDAPELAVRTDAVTPSRADRPWWQRIINTVRGLPGDKASTPAAAVVRLPEEVRLARQTPVRRRTASSCGQAPLRICPVHYIELPPSGRCDECFTG